MSISLEQQMKEKNLDIFASFLETEGKQIQGLVERIAHRGIKICEIGSWKGHSTAYLAQVAKKYKGKVYAIDTWQGSPGVSQHEIAKTKDMFALFQKNMEALGLNKYIQPFRMSSLAAALLVKDEFFNLIFIDGDHLYHAVKADIETYLKKLKPGGILCGHDCEAHYSDLSPEIKKQIDLNCRGINDQEHIKELFLHPGVIKSLYEIFDDKYEIFPETRRVWYWQKPLTSSKRLNTSNKENKNTNKTSTSSSFYKYVKKVVYSVPPLLFFYRKMFYWYYNSHRGLFIFSRNIPILVYKVWGFFNQDIAVFSHRFWAFLNQDVIDAYRILKTLLRNEVLIPFSQKTDEEIKKIEAMKCHQKYLSKSRSPVQNMRLLNKIIEESRDDNEVRKFLEIDMQRLKSCLNPRKKTIAFCFTTEAYRENLGNLVKKFRTLNRYNVVTLVGKVMGDKCETGNVHYIPLRFLDLWANLNFADIHITPCPFLGPSPKKTVYFLHDIHDSPTADKNNNFRTSSSFDYTVLSSQFNLEREKRYILGGKPDHTICLIPGGYPKLDNNLRYIKSHRYKKSNTIIFATTMLGGPDTEGLLAFPEHGAQIIKALLESLPDYNVIFRPHPLSTHFPEVKEAVSLFSNYPKFIYDDNASHYMEKYAKSQMMITDASGTAYTYAFTTLRPVVFFSPNETETQNRFGDYKYYVDREKVGLVAQDIPDLIEKTKYSLNNCDKVGKGIQQYRDSFVFNIGHSEDYFIKNFHYILENKRHPDWEYV